jgi:hypothetical protein
MQIKNISIRNLLHHTSGLRDQWNLLRLAGWGLDDIITNEDVLNLIYNQKELNFMPNEEFMYSNSGYTLLAEIVSRISNMSFAEFTKKRIFQPLKMNNSSFIDTQGAVIPNKANSYYKKEDIYVEDLFNNTSVGATNLSTTIEDLSKWTINFTEPKVGTKAIFKKMNTLGKLKNGKNTAYGFGQFIDTYKGVYRISHSGVDASYQAFIGRFPEPNINIIIASNNSSIDGGRMVEQLINICLKDYLNKTPNETSQKRVARKVPIKISNSALKSFIGHYWNKKDRYSREIVIKNDTLYYLRENDNKSVLVPIGNAEFEMLGDEYISVSFKVNEMILTFNDGYIIEFQKYKPTNYNSNDLLKYCGTYYSQELNTTYSFNIDGGQLVANHQRLGDFKLKSIMKNYFMGGKGSFRDVYFDRDTSGNIIGFKVSSSRAKNILFKKVKD